jgi:ParB/RepB/Spo0J family partition protein
MTATATPTAPRGTSKKSGKQPEMATAARPAALFEIAVADVLIRENVRTDVGDLEDLAESIRQHGILQPVRVQESYRDQGKYELIYGQRRFRAAQLVGLETIPALVEGMPGGALDVVRLPIQQLVENVQRRDLNPLEEARALRGILDASEGMTQDQLAAKVGRSRPAVTNLLRILDLEPKVQELVASGELSAAHAKALVGLKPAQQMELAKRAVESGYSAHSTEESAKWYRQQNNGDERKARESAKAAKRALKALEEADVATTTQVLLAVPWNLDRDVVQMAVSEAGYTMAKVWGFRRSSDCDCDAVQVDVQDGDGTKVAPACISADHAEAHNAAMRAASEQKAKEEAVDRDTVRKAFRASLDAANLHPTAARLILRELDSYGGPKWGEYEAMTDVAVLDRLAERLAVRWGTAYGSPVPLKKVLKAFEASAA